jgi:hypothetical protein
MDISELNRIKSSANFKRHPWEITRAKAVHYLLKKNRLPFSHLADVGSGDIFILQTLARNKMADSFSAIDSDYTNELITQLKKSPYTSDINFYSGINEVTGKKSDGVLLLDVLEHCENDKELIQQLTAENFSTGNSLFFITVPAFQKLFSQHDTLLKHYRRYSRKQIINTCKSQGLDILSSGYFFFSLLPARLFLILFEKLKLRKAKKSIDNWNGNKFLTRIISSILWADFRVCHSLSRIGIHLPGLSCYCICRKLPS